MSVGENIKKARKNAGLTQKELAEKLHVKAATISAFEKDKTNIKLDTVKKIARGLNVPVGELLEENWKEYFSSGELAADAICEMQVLHKKLLETKCEKEATAVMSLIAHLQEFYDCLKEFRKETGYDSCGIWKS